MFSIDKRKIKLFICSVMQYVLSFSLILNMRSVYVHSLEMAWMKKIAVFLMVFSVSIIILASNNTRKNNIKIGVLLALLLFLYLMTYYIIFDQPSRILKYAIEIAVLAFYIFSVKDAFEDTMKKYVNIVCVIALISLFFWIFASQLHIIHETGAWKLDWGGSSGNAMGYIRSYYNIYFETQSISLPYFGLVIRNSSIFTEAPMSSYIFVIALLFELFLKEESNKKIVLLLIVSICTTISFTGIGIASLSLIIFYFKQGYLSKNRSIVSAACKLIIAVLALALIVSVLVVMFNSKMNSTSGVSRTSDFVKGLKSWLEHPILGHGYNGMDDESFGFSNSIIPILTEGGLYILFLYLIPLSLVLIQTGSFSYKQLSFYLLFFLMFVVTIVPYQNLTFFIFLSMVKCNEQYAFYQKKSVKSGMKKINI